TYVRGMERFANDGLMLAEQVWDGVGNATAHDYKLGQNTDSATPLAWTHAEYLKLLRSLADGKVWDNYEPVQSRYAR
uniref:glycoside hydrolase family 15 protein n=1 Tax=Brevundimonas sp. TaxID=1871086 RepID=UPI0025B92777